jgi:uncharacterized membrane protein
MWISRLEGQNDKRPQKVNLSEPFLFLATVIAFCFSVTVSIFCFTLFPKLNGFFQRLSAFLLIVEIKSILTGSPQVLTGAVIGTGRWAGVEND